MNRIVEKVNFPIPKQPKAKRVAAYARVSSGKDEMLHSLSAQISYYSELIQSHPGWLYCGVFSDEAYTGTKDNRTGFQNLISECRSGNIDLIITKSISRFARNTVTLLETVRELKLLGIDVFFICDNCGAKYKRTTSKGKHAWQCKTFLTQGKAFCPSRQIPEEELYRLATEVLELDKFDENILHSKIKNIRAKNNCTLTFYLSGGKEVSKNWVPRSRKNSWTAEMRECARQRALNQKGIV